MPEKSSRRSFLKSAIALSGAGVALPALGCASGPPATRPPGRLLSVKELYDMCVDSERLGDNPTLLDDMIQLGIVEALNERGLAMECPAERVQALLDKHAGNSGHRNDLKAALKNNRWGLRRYGEPEIWHSACPWADCPP